MFFDSLDDALSIARKTSAVLFVIPKDMDLKINNDFILQPEEKSVITIDQIRNMIARLSNKQIRDTFVLIRPADLMNEAAANAFLKILEEPNDKIHFVLATDSPSKILSTILSRVAIYFLKSGQKMNSKIVADEKDKVLAKRLLVAKPVELVDLAEEIAKKKGETRAYAMNILGLAIEMLYKSYFLTGKDVFIKKIPKFLKAYDAIAQNGHVKLQIVSNLC